MIRLTGTLTCATPDDATIVETWLPDHIRLSRAEPGCVAFNVTRTDNRMVWHLDETYLDRPAFEAHQTRNRASVWWQKSCHIPRDFKLAES